MRRRERPPNALGNAADNPQHRADDKAPGAYNLKRDASTQELAAVCLALGVLLFDVLSQSIQATTQIRSLSPKSLVMIGHFLLQANKVELDHSETLLDSRPVPWRSQPGPSTGGDVSATTKARASEVCFRGTPRDTARKLSKPLE